jgi:hypothetical protein
VLLPGGGPPQPAPWKGIAFVPFPHRAWHLPDPATGPLLSPFTGEPVKALGRVIVAKIDNIAQARPPTGLASADIVYLLPVEGGLSRIFAVYSSRIPKDDSRLAPHNLYASGRVLWAEARGASTARDIGFRFGPTPPGGRPTASFSVSYPAASFTFRWWGRTRRWLVWMDGTQATDAAGGHLGAATVIIQDTVVRTSRFAEYGVPPPYAQSAGSGTAVVLRDGRAWRVHWSRPNPHGGTTYTLPSGARMTFGPGQEWVVLTTTNWATAGL